MDKKEFKDQMKKVASEKNVALTDDMLDQVAGGYYSNWNDLDRDTQLRLQQESILNMARGQHCEIFDNDHAVEYNP